MKWLEHYDPGVPVKCSYPEETLVDVLADHALRNPDGVALRFKGRSITFRELDVQSDALAKSFHCEGIRAGDRIAIVLPNCPQFLITQYAAWKVGAIIAPLNPIYTDRELAEAFEMAEPKLVIALTPFYDKVRRATKARVIATNIKEYLPQPLRVLFTVAKEKKEGHRIKLQPSDAWFQPLLKKRGCPLVPQPADAAVILMSGGTTGTPKGVLCDHRGLIIAGTQLLAWLREAVEGEGASIMLPLPLFHTYGCAGAQSLAMLGGIPLILVPNPRDVDDVVKTIDRERPTLFCGVPTLFNALLNHRDVQRGKVDFKSIVACFSGAAALLAETKKRFEELTGGRIVEGYSLTEATMACCVNPLHGANKIGSVGMPLPDVVVRIVDSDDASKELGGTEVGEILFRAPQLMCGYWNNPDETSIMLRNGWLHTGDLGYLDEDGYLFLVDRKKDMIKTSGYQVWPREIEEVLASHPAVAEVGVAGLPDQHRGEVITAWVVARPGQTIDGDALRAYCKERLAPYKVPVRIETRMELPKTLVGKVLRRVLVSEARAESGAA
jgi:long-chain acyl-CoA synthetase